MSNIFLKIVSHSFNVKQGYNKLCKFLVMQALQKPFGQSKLILAVYKVRKTINLPISKIPTIVYSFSIQFFL